MFDYLKQKKHQIFPGMVLMVFLLLFSFPANGDLYDFYVDAGSTKLWEDGSENYPFKTITTALDYVRSKGLEEKNILVKKGTYAESVELTNDVNLIGEDRYETVINGEGQNRGIFFHSTKSLVKNLTVKKASVNLKIDKKSKAKIEKCSIKDSKRNGIEVDHSSRSKKYKFTLKNSSVKNSGARGMYIFRRKLEIKGNKISENGEEGIDLHTNVRGTISNNEIKNNKESGIEMIMAGANVSIRENKISSNQTQGVTIQVYDSRLGKVRLANNDITNNKRYGVRYTKYNHRKMKMKFENFIAKCVKCRNNSFSGNSNGDYGYQ